MRGRLPILDSNCLSDIANGDQKAFCRFFDAFKNKIYSFSFSFTHSSQIAEEITQDVFIKAWAHRESLPDIQNLDAWLSTITRNLCFNYLKKLALERKTAVTLVRMQTRTDENVEQYLSYKERVSEIGQALEQLSPQQRLIFTLNRDKGLKNEEIAHQLNLSPNTVKTHMVTALRKIRSFLESHATHLFTLALLFLKNI
ncbi:MAG: RNA polymerase sigma-70 factor [Flavisolibacter sp.]